MLPSVISSLYTIREFPSSCLTPEQAKRQWSTLGDLHANALLFLFFLIKQGAVKMPRPKFREFVELYSSEANTLPEMTAKIAAFNRLISTITVTAGANIRLIGDEVADRGQNDYYILKLIETLDQGGANLEIMISNHGMEFIYERELEIDQDEDEDEEGSFAPMMRVSSDPAHGFMYSLDNLRVYEEAGVIDFEEVERLHQLRQSKLKALSYDYDSHGNIFIYSHAPIDPDDILQVALGLQVVNRHELPHGGVLALRVEHLTLMIDRINRVFCDAALENTVSYLMEKRGKEAVICQGRSSVLVFERLTWKRSEPFYDFPDKVFNVHGHDNKSHPQHLNLDGNLGKSLEACLGLLKYRQSQLSPPPALVRQAQTHTQATTHFSGHRRAPVEQDSDATTTSKRLKKDN